MSDLFVEIVRWLDPVNWPQVPFSGRKISKGHWDQIKIYLVRQGISPYLAAILPGTSLHYGFPPDFKLWLDSESHRNKNRIEAMLSDLERILAAANKAGITIMPLKGSLLTQSHYPAPHWRPMADLDLLVRRRDLEPLTAVLQHLGYRGVAETNVYARHAVFAHPTYERIISWDGEHPENPRPVEIHTQIHRPFWGNLDSPDLTELLWDSSRQAHMFGWPVSVPSDLALLAHLCIHTLQDMLTQKARLIQLLDLAYVAPAVNALDQLPFPQWMYPPLCLSQRVFGGMFQNVSLQSLAMQTPKNIREFFQRVPIDHSCGLARMTPQPLHGSMRLHWDRWKPLRWRMQLVYGETSYPAMLLRHLAAALSHFDQIRSRR